MFYRSPANLPFHSLPCPRRGRRSSVEIPLRALEHVPQWLGISGGVLAVPPRSRMFQALPGRAPLGDLFQGKHRRTLSLMGRDEVGIPNPRIPACHLPPEPHVSAGPLWHRGACPRTGSPMAQPHPLQSRPAQTPPRTALASRLPSSLKTEPVPLRPSPQGPPCHLDLQVFTIPVARTGADGGRNGPGMFPLRLELLPLPAENH